MATEKLPTQFAPAERAPQSEVQKQTQQLMLVPLFREVFEAVPDVLMVLNQERQIVYFNKRVMALLGLEDYRAVCGKRPGEVLECVHSGETAGGCGTTESCRMCGMVHSILESQQGQVGTHECRISQENGSALDLKIQATPFAVGQRQFSVLSVTDISDTKRLKAMEQAFFSEVLDSARGLQSSLEHIALMHPELEGGEANEAFRLSRKLVDDINLHRLLVAAENCALKVRLSPINTNDFIQQIADYYAAHPLGESRSIRIAKKASGILLTTDRTLLKIVLNQMLKNALEAVAVGQTVTVGADYMGNNAMLWVQNPGVMPRDVQLQVFQRSFTTKGEGRGLGTYMMRLLSERYLKGRVAFETSGKTGTIFQVILPMTLSV